MGNQARQSVPTLTATCDGGCSGEVSIQVLRDPDTGRRFVSGVVEPQYGHGYVEADVEAATFGGDGDLVVLCPALHLVSETTCGGLAIFAAAEVAEGQRDLTPIAGLIVEVETA